MKIRYSNWTQFHDGLMALVERGIMFEADADKLTIILTGGF
jgi:hypothetical protein